MATEVTTPGKIMLKQVVPADMKDELGELDKGGAAVFFKKLAERHPDKYVDVLDRMTDLARNVSTEYGRWTSISPEDFKLPPKVAEYRKDLKEKIHKISQDPVLTPQEKNRRISGMLKSRIEKIQNMVQEEALKAGNSFAISSAHGFRGNPTQLTQMLFGDIVVADNEGGLVPLPMLQGYAEGLSPLELFAGSYASRQGFSSTQFATADTGYLSKQITGLSTGLQVLEEDCGTDKGLVLDPQSPRAAGRFLMEEAGTLPAGEALVPGKIKRAGRSPVRVRSALTCALPYGVCQKCAGHLGDGKLPDVGAYVGTDMGRTTTEPMTQLMALCLDPDTEVRMADLSVKKLKDIKIGDEVLGSDRHGNVAPAAVVNIWNNGLQNLSRYSYRSRSFSDIVSVEASAKHRMLTARDEPEEKVQTLGSLDAAALSGLLLSGPAAGNPGKLKEYEQDTFDLENVSSLGEKESMDIELDNADHLFVLANGLVVSNSAKHTGGQVKTDESDYLGFDAVNQMWQVPDSWKGAVQTEEDGLVKSVRKAPQGGHFVQVGEDDELFVPEGRKLTVKKGDRLYAGDPVSEGILNPKLVARHRGIGAGRKFFSDEFGKMLEENKMGEAGTNVDILSRAFINNVKIDDPDGVVGFRYGETVPYDTLARYWKTRKDARERSLKNATGKYLEKPVLHHTIGTRITPSISDELKSAGVSKVTVHDNSPGFTPYITRAASRSLDDRDWKARLAGYYLKRAYQDAVTLGATDRPEGRKSVFAGLMDPERLEPAGQ